ncbi:MAG: phosphotransferase family protein [Streptosporangiaceae bacterium]
MKPFVTPSGCATFWPLLRKPSTHERSWCWLGDVLRRLHLCKVPAGAISLSDPCGVIRLRLETYSRLKQHDRGIYNALIEMSDEAEMLFHSVSAAAPQCLIHGDVHMENVLMDGSRAYLSDYETSGIGPRLWDLAQPVALNWHRGLPNHSLEEFFEAYGYDPQGTKEFADLMFVRDLLDTSYIAEIVNRHPEAESELAFRLRSGIGDPARLARWRFLRPRR